MQPYIENCKLIYWSYTSHSGILLTQHSNLGRKVHNLSCFLDESKPNWRYGTKVIHVIRKGKAFTCKNTPNSNPTSHPRLPCHGFALMSEYQNKFVYVANKWNTLVLYIIKRLFLIEKLTITSMSIQVSTPFHNGKSLSLYNIKSS